jgi:hypothetical protein
VPQPTNHSNSASRWTLADLEQLDFRLNNGETIQDIAKLTSRSQEAVRAKAWQRGLLPKRKT